MPRSSVLTSGLDALAHASPAIAKKLQELYALDDELQDAHEDAKRDEENGERVVAAYEAFLHSREGFIQQLQKDKVAVPWQLRMRIDDIELTLRERKLKRDLVAKRNVASNGKETRPSSDEATTGSTDQTLPTADHDATKKDDPLLMFKAMILPAVFMALVAAQNQWKCVISYEESIGEKVPASVSKAPRNSHAASAALHSVSPSCANAQ